MTFLARYWFLVVMIWLFGMAFVLFALPDLIVAWTK